jgi:hypothetical protein
MRFLCIYRPGSPESEAPPTAEEQAKMGKLIDEMSKAGVLLTFEGCMVSRFGAKVRVDGAKYSVTDGPFPETKEVVGGLAILQVKTKDEAVEWTKRFLAVAGEGESELRQLWDGPG